ncbi:hypothetical protein IGI04_008869 [Brassica rapa subsp. trilocularis]|uniref:S-protein homolog n=1 Tax=Brassica rapa subsp. trilocularis TaxID=1813537 RepID=A0ABQ7MVM4_BRACM|nr:hypothetical protein IGI04_008869 [Brassica rapa subsp. trilocularis]
MNNLYRSLFIIALGVGLSNALAIKMKNSGIEFRFHAKFMAYKSGGLILHYGKKNFWFCRDDGIYFTHGKQTPKLEYKWVYKVIDMAPSPY